MTRGQVTTWVRETEAMWGMFSKFRQQVEQMHATLPMLQASGNAEQYVKAEREYAQASAQLAAVEQAVFERLNARDYDAAEQALVDLRLRVDQMQEMFVEWRGKQQKFELAVMLNDFGEEGDDDELSRPRAEGILSTCKTRYDKALELVEVAIPNRAVLIHA